MASKKTQSVDAAVLDSQDGYLRVRALEDASLEGYLQTYSARIGGYRVQPNEYGHRVTMKIEFEGSPSHDNVNLWSFFIAQAAHKLGKKPTVQVGQQNGMMVGYVTFMIWGQVKYMESKGSNNPDF